MAKKRLQAIAPMAPRVLNGEQTAAYIGVSYSKFRELVVADLFTVKPLPYGTYFDIRQVDAWLDEVGGVENVEKLHEKAWLEAANG